MMDALDMIVDDSINTQSVTLKKEVSGSCIVTELFSQILTPFPLQTWLTSKCQSSVPRTVPAIRTGT